ncbi:MAG: 2Fe-2S iron-sulfur cluster binding domain-containing protein [Candidatus Omnitrophota bacterium]|jgi:ferredoxin
MAKLVINGKAFDLADGADIAPLCLAEGVPFNCNTGVCGSCVVMVLSGAAHLSPLTEEEVYLGLDEGRRLACQCRITGGKVELQS